MSKASELIDLKAKLKQRIVGEPDPDIRARLQATVDAINAQLKAGRKDFRPGRS